MSSSLTRCFSFLTPGARCSQFFSNTRKIANQAKSAASLSEDLWGSFGCAAAVAKEILVRNSHTENNATSSQNENVFSSLSKVEEACLQAADLSKLLGTGSHLVQLISGSAFYFTDSDGTFVVRSKVVEGKKGVVWEKCRKSTLSVLSNISRLASNLLKSTGILGNLSLVKLGSSHTQVMASGNILGLVSSALGAADDVSCIRKQARANREINEQESENLKPLSKFARCKMLFFSLLCNLVDLLGEALSFIFVVIPRILGGHAALILGVFGFLSSVGNCVLDIIGMLD